MIPVFDGEFSAFILDSSFLAKDDTRPLYEIVLAAEPEPEGLSEEVNELRVSVILPFLGEHHGDVRVR